MGTASEGIVEAGQALTARTMQLLTDAERRFPTTLHTAIVFFRDGFNQEQMDLLWNEERNSYNRGRRYSLAVTHADQMQASVRNFLWNSPGARDCFRDCCDFFFEPDRHIRRFSISNTLVVPATSQLVAKIAGMENVLGIDLDFPIYFPNGIEVHSRGEEEVEVIESPELVVLGDICSRADDQNGYTWGWNRLGIRQAHADGWYGAGGVIGLADTGVCADHADLIFKVKDFVKVTVTGKAEQAHSSDAHGHGTHVAGTCAGADNSGVQIGGAPFADLKAAAVIDPDYGGTAVGLIGALEWLTDDQRKADVINLSIGIASPPDSRARILEHAIDGYRAQGTICVAAIGNHATTCVWPGSFANVIGCGAFQPDGKVWSSSGHRPDYILPGVSVFSCVPHGLQRYQGHSYVRMRGTSMATAHMTALVELLMNAHRKAPPDKIVDAFKTTASNGAQYKDDSGWGVPDLLAASAWLKRQGF
jgi:hypothetical protein